VPAYRLTLEYDGTAFHGWQAQPRERTVEGALREALHRLGEQPPRLTAAGRTDAGAHAHAQTVGVALHRRWEPATLAAALNAHLPADVVVVAAATCAEHFHARRDAVSRTYRYVVLCRGSRVTVARQYAWAVRGPLDVDGMRAAARALVGTHDFASFGAATAPGGTTVRTVDAAAVDHVVLGRPADRRAVEAVVLTVRANAFLRGMMRAFAGALVAVGQGRMTPAAVAQLLVEPARRESTITVAPARGLHQWAVTYPVTEAA